MNIRKMVIVLGMYSICAAGVFGGNELKAEAANVAVNAQNTGNMGNTSVANVEKEVRKNPITEVLKTVNLKEKTDITSVTDFSAVFDAEYYYQQYPDLQVKFGKDADALLKHFKEFGMKEGRCGNASFNVRAYMKNNLDLVGLIKADDFTKYYAHYIKYGEQEGRIATYQQGQEPMGELLSTHTTYYDVTQARAANVELAASRINGTLLAPGKSFSFSLGVGTRTVANGYVNGPSFAGGKEVESIGGGICQVSSNLYVSLLLAGIEPDEHHYHGLAVDYVPIGLDAAIAEGAWDLRFTNPFEHKVMIEAIAKDGVLTINLLRK